MKKILLVFCFIAVSYLAQAQLFVGGGISMYANSLAVEEQLSEKYVENMSTQVGFTVTPAIGYMIPGRTIGFGLSLGYGTGTKNDHTYHYIGTVDPAEDFVKSRTNAFDIAPFFRFVYGKFEKITLYADAKLPIGISYSKAMNEGSESNDKTFVWGLRLVPGLTYKFSDHILFTTEIGLLSINYLNTKTESNSGKIDRKSDFNIGGNVRTIPSFGFVYLF